ncbi:hypothetical protein [Coleofasciculus sp.]|uniref:hypothetical protein n=1 Tax=Coleofasciculus sp. TaxID=3100458 RepID=UPI0039FB07AC
MINKSLQIQLIWLSSIVFSPKNAAVERTRFHDCKGLADSEKLAKYNAAVERTRFHDCKSQGRISQD